MNATASLLADTICRTVELGETISDAAVADELTHLFCAPVTLDPICPGCGMAGRFPTWLNLVRKVGGVESVDQVGDLGGYRGGGVDGLPGDGQLEGAVALEGPDQALDG